MVGGEYQRNVYSANRQRNVRSSFVLARASVLPGRGVPPAHRLLIRRRQWWPVDTIHAHRIEVVDGRFSRRYLVEATDADFAHQLLDAVAIERILRSGAAWVEAAGGVVAIGSQPGRLWNAAAMEDSLAVASGLVAHWRL